MFGRGLNKGIIVGLAIGVIVGLWLRSRRVSQSDLAKQRQLAALQRLKGLDREELLKLANELIDAVRSGRPIPEWATDMPDVVETVKDLLPKRVVIQEFFIALVNRV